MILIIIVIACAFIAGFCIRLNELTTVSKLQIRGHMLYPNVYVREAQPKDVWKALIWPLSLLWFILVGLVYLTNQALVIVFLFFGFHYNRTCLYKFIDNISDN